MPPGFVDQQGPSVLLYFTDGSTGTLLDGQSSLKGRTLDQIVRIELHPADGGVVRGTRHDGVEVVGVSYNLAELPFPVVAFVPFDAAKVIAAQLGQVASGLVVADRLPLL